MSIQDQGGLQTEIRRNKNKFQHALVTRHKGIRTKSPFVKPFYLAWRNITSLVHMKGHTIYRTANIKRICHCAIVQDFIQTLSAITSEYLTKIFLSAGFATSMMTSM